MKKMALLALFLLASTVHAGTVIKFKGGSYPIKKKTGEFVEVVQAEFDQSDKGENLLVFTKKDGTEGFALTDDIESFSLKEIIKMAEGDTNQNIEVQVPTSPPSIKPENQVEYDRLKRKSERLGEEIGQKEKDLNNQLKSMASSGEYYFDSRKYCKEVSNVVGGSYQIEEGCMQNERTSERNLRDMSLPSEIIKYCKEVSNVVGGSYQIMFGCATNELNAKRSLGR